MLENCEPNSFDFCPIHVVSTSDRQTVVSGLVLLLVLLAQDSRGQIRKTCAQQNKKHSNVAHDHFVFSPPSEWGCEILK